MAELSELQKEAIVTQLAMFTRPADVVVHMQEEWGLQIDRFQVRTYDPTNLRFEAGEKWRGLFEDVRAAYIAEVEKVPLANKGYRLNQLQKLFDTASAAGNISVASSLLEQAAKEVGGALTNRHDHQLSLDRRPADLSPDERYEQLVEHFRQALEERRSEEERLGELRAA